jgi:hypothetical protein
VESWRARPLLRSYTFSDTLCPSCGAINKQSQISTGFDWSRARPRRAVPNRTNNEFKGQGKGKVYLRHYRAENRSRSRWNLKEEDAAAAAGEEDESTEHARIWERDRTD